MSAKKDAVAQRKATLLLNRQNLDIAAARRLLWKAQRARDWSAVEMCYHFIAGVYEEQEEAKT